MTASSISNIESWRVRPVHTFSTIILRREPKHWGIVVTFRNDWTGQTTTYWVSRRTDTKVLDVIYYRDEVGMAVNRIRFTSPEEARRAALELVECGLLPADKEERNDE